MVIFVKAENTKCLKTAPECIFHPVSVAVTMFVFNTVFND